MVIVRILLWPCVNHAEGAWMKSNEWNWMKFVVLSSDALGHAVHLSAIFSTFNRLCVHFIKDYKYNVCRFCLKYSRKMFWFGCVVLALDCASFHSLPCNSAFIVSYVSVPVYMAFLSWTVPIHPVLLSQPQPRVRVCVCGVYNVRIWSGFHGSLQ